MSTIGAHDPWEEEDRLFADATPDRDFASLSPGELRAGFVLDARGRARPWLATALFLGLCPLVPYPDAMVESALGTGDPDRARQSLRDSPARRCLRGVDALLADPVPWLRLLEAAGPVAPRPGELADVVSLGPWVLDSPWACLHHLRSVTDRWTDATVGAVLAALTARPPHSSWMDAWARALRAASLLAPEQTSEVDLLTVAGWIVRVYAENPLIGSDPDLITAALDRVFAERTVLPEWRGPTPVLLADARESPMQLSATYVLGGLTHLVDRHGLPTALLPAIREVAASPCEWRLRGSLGRAPERETSVVARWLLHRAREPWFTHLPAAARDETLATLGVALEQEDGGRATWLLAGLGRALALGVAPGQRECEAWERSVGMGRGLGRDGMGQLWRVGMLLPGASARVTRRAGSLESLVNELPTDWRVPVLFEALSAPHLADQAAARLSALAAADDRAAAMALLTRAKAGPLPPAWLDGLAAALTPALRRDPVVTGELENARRRTS